MNETVDLTFLKSFAGNSPEKMAKYINIFLNSAPAAMSTMEACMRNQDWGGLRSAAHSLKPQISYMGIKSGEELVKSIEQNASEKINLDRIPQQVLSLKDILEKAYPELKQAADF